MTTIAPPKPVAPSQPSHYLRLISLARDAHLLGSAGSILGWDQETMMPPGGLDHRSRQMAQLARLTHQMATDPQIADMLAKSEGDRNLTRDPLSVEAVNIRELRRQYDRRTKLPPDLVEEEALLASRAKHEWAEARKDSNFKKFQPWLEKIVALLQRKADCYGYDRGGEPWDALAEDYEPGCTAKQVEAVFTPLRKRLQTLLDALMGSPVKPSNAFNELRLPVDQQEKFVRFVAEQIGFN